MRINSYTVTVKIWKYKDGVLMLGEPEEHVSIGLCFAEAAARIRTLLKKENGSVPEIVSVTFLKTVSGVFEFIPHIPIVDAPEEITRKIEV